MKSLDSKLVEKFKVIFKLKKKCFKKESYSKKN